LVVHLPVEKGLRRQPSRAARGSTMLELALILSVGLPLLLGVTGVGVRLGATLCGTQLTRDVGHMYALGADFSQPGVVDIAQALSTNFTLTSSGTAVLILSQIVQVYQADCTAASLKTCPNLNQPVFINRIVLGNSSLRASSYGTPTASYLDSSGNITSSNYLQQSALLANPFGAVMTLADGQIAYLTEGYFSMPQLDLLDPITNEKGGYYVRFVF
jgi:hypothetical protein